MSKTKPNNKSSYDIPQADQMAWARGDADPSPRKSPPMETSWAEKVKGNQRKQKVTEVKEEKVAGTAISLPPSASPQRDHTKTGTETKSGCWFPMSQWDEPETKTEVEESQGRAWQEVGTEGPHGKLTWAEEVELTQEVWYNPDDGSVLCVGPPSPSTYRHSLLSFP